MTRALRRMNPRTVLADACAELGIALPSPLSRLSKARAVRIINARLEELDLEPIRLGSSFAAIAAYVAERAEQIDEGGGGGDAPDWVPADAYIHIDLVGGDPQGRAWVRGVGEVAVDTLLGGDPNTENGWGATEYDPESLTDEGLTGPAIAFIGAARSKLLTGATFTFRTKATDDVSGSRVLALVSANGNDAIQFSIDGNDHKGKVSSWGGSLSVETDVVANEGDDSINVFAGTITSARAEIALNGSDAVAGVPDATDRPTDNPFVAVLIDFNGTAYALQSITLYDPLPDAAGLSALSETGVVNTAPYDLTYVTGWNDDAPFQISLSGPVAETVQIADTFEAADDEGNPLLIEMTDDGSGAFMMVDLELGYPGAIVTEAVPLKQSIVVQAARQIDPDETVNFTLRATDPGGLYVEQEFTITVTA